MRFILPAARWRRTLSTFPFTCALVVSATALGAQPTKVDLRRALEIAHSNNAVLQAARSRIEESRGDLVTASVRLMHAPELSLAIGEREAGVGTNTTDFSVELDQQFERRGRRDARLRQSASRLRARKHDEADVARVVDLAVALAYYDAVAESERALIRGEDGRLAESLFALSLKRLEAGEGTPLELNTARLRRASARRRVFEAEAHRRSVTLRLHQLLGMGVESGLVLSDALPRRSISQTEDELVAIARETRPDGRALQELIEAARAGVDLASAGSWPGLRAGLSFEREESDEILTASISIPLSTAPRGRGERIQKVATLERVLAEHRGLELAIETEVRRAFTEYRRAEATVELFDIDVVAAQDESLALLERSLEEGEIGYAEVVVVQRELLEARAGYLDARLAFARARATLLATANLPQVQAGPGGNS